MPNVIDLARYRGKIASAQRQQCAPSSLAGAIHFEHKRDGTYSVTYEGIYARHTPVAAEHLADALLQLTIEIRGT